VTLLEEQDEFLEQATDALGVLSLDRDLVAAHVNVSTEGLLDEAKQRIALAEEPDHEMVAGNEDFDLGRSHGVSIASVLPAHYPGGQPSGRPPRR
jgi:hypothetical protein